MFNIINYAVIYKVPTEFFYLCQSFWFNIMGGVGIFALGYYGYGASISTDETRTTTLGIGNIPYSLGYYDRVLLS